jgi:energy-coupling factor transporter ATP-binding protein EcfA2
MSLIAENLSFTYSFRGGECTAVREISAEFAPGIPHLICGPSGSGKSTLSLLLAGLLTPSGGEVKLNGEDLAAQRSRIAFVFQFAETIFFEDSVREELKQWMGSNADHDPSVFGQLGIDYSGIADTHPFHLSQGMSRLTAIALQVARSPQLLLLDEPTIGLDPDHERCVIELLRNWISPQRILIVVTHDLDVMRKLGGQAWVLKGGELVWSGETAILIQNHELLKSYGLEV